MLEGISLERTLFFAIGLGILVFEAHRQFNHPAYAATESGGAAESDYIYSLSPSEIRSRSAFFSAELVYILAIAAMFAALVFSEAVNDVLKYIIGFLGQMGYLAQGPAGGMPAEPAGAGGAGGAATLVPSYTSGDPAIDAAAEPFVVSVMMVTALRFPLVRRLEEKLRGGAQQLFGIPWIPHRLRQSIQDATIDLEAIESELTVEDVNRSYAGRIAHYRERAQAAGASQGRVGNLAAALAKLGAYQIWVNELKLWPSQEFRSDFRFFHDLNEPLSDQIDALFKDCDLLASSDSGGEAAANGERHRMHQELWELKAKQASRLARKQAAMMALFDQNSQWPDNDRPGAARLRAFLENARSDPDWVFRINVAISLLIISAAVSCVAGYVYAGWIERIADGLGVIGEGEGMVAPDDAQFDRVATALDFMVSSLIVYGLSMWAALSIRGRMRRKGRWTNPFERGRRIPPMAQLALFFAVLAALVYVANLAYMLQASEDWEFLATERDAGWWRNLSVQANLSVFFAIIGAFHGTAVALMMDLGARKAEGRGWLIVAAVYIAAMMLLGYGLGQYYSIGSHEDIRAMREMLYAIDLGLIALFTSIAMMSFLRPDTEADSGGMTPQMATGETTA